MIPDIEELGIGAADEGAGGSTIAWRLILSFVGATLGTGC
jgi:hypothetical protein